MYLPRSYISILYQRLQRTHHPLSPPILILVSLEPDALCGCRILTHLLKRDYIPHKIQPIAGYNDLETAGQNVIRPMMESQGGSGGVVICIGAGGLIDMAGLLGVTTGLPGSVEDYGGVEVWVIDSKRPWNLGNALGGIILRPGETEEEVGVVKGRITRTYEPGRGGIIVFDDGDIEEDLAIEKESFFILKDMPRIPDEDQETDDDESNLDEDENEEADESPNLLPNTSNGRKRKSLSDTEDEDIISDEENGRPRQRRRENSSSPMRESPSRPERRGLMSLSGPPINLRPSRSVSPTPAQAPKAPSARTLRRRLLKLRKKHESVVIGYYNLGAWYSEPIASMMYSLASELGREDNDLLWHAIVGVTSMEIYGRSSTGVAITGQRSSPAHNPDSGWLGVRGSRIRQLLRDEVRRLNPPELMDSSTNGNHNGSESTSLIPITARYSTDTSIRLSPEPKFLLIRHWSLYESMLHSPYLSARLRVWSDAGRKRLNKLLAKMGISLVQCKQNYVYMDMKVKQDLRKKLLKYSKLYGLEDLVPPVETNGRDRWDAKEDWGFVRSWGWKATLSAHDVSIVLGALLEVGKHGIKSLENGGWDRGRELKDTSDEEGLLEGEEWVGRFWDAYDALENVDDLKKAIPIAQHLHRAILRTGTTLIEKRQIRHLRAFRMCVVKDGPDVTLFNHPSALTKLALWIGEAVAEQERESKGKVGNGGRGTPLVVASLNETRGIYVVVGTGGGGLNYEESEVIDARRKRREDRQQRREARETSRRNKQKVREERCAAREAAKDDDDDDEEDEMESEGSSDSSAEESEDEPVVRNLGYGRNRFGNAFQEVVEETNARVRIDSFEHCVVEVRKEDLTAFIESLSTMAVVVG